MLCGHLWGRPDFPGARRASPTPDTHAHAHAREALRAVLTTRLISPASPGSSRRFCLNAAAAPCGAVRVRLMFGTHGDCVRSLRTYTQGSHCGYVQHNPTRARAALFERRVSTVPSPSTQCRAVEESARTRPQASRGGQISQNSEAPTAGQPRRKRGPDSGPGPPADTTNTSVTSTKPSRKHRGRRHTAGARPRAHTHTVTYAARFGRAKKPAALAEMSARSPPRGAARTQVPPRARLRGVRAAFAGGRAA